MVIELKGRGFALVAMVLSFIAGNLRRNRQMPSVSRESVAAASLQHPAGASLTMLVPTLRRVAPYDATAAISRERMHAAREFNRSPFAHAILTTADRLASRRPWRQSGRRNCMLYDAAVS